MNTLADAAPWIALSPLAIAVVSQFSHLIREWRAYRAQRDDFARRAGVGP